MEQITLKVDGMMCGMCESHVNEAVRKAFPKAKKVTSSHSKGQTVILTEEDIWRRTIKSRRTGPCGPPWSPPATRYWDTKKSLIRKRGCLAG